MFAARYPPLDFHPISKHRFAVSVAELQKSIAKLPAGPRRSVAKYVAYLKRRDAPARRRLLAEIGREMEAGKSYSQAEVDAALARHPRR
jgi:hypothetical protein